MEGEKWWKEGMRGSEAERGRDVGKWREGGEEAKSGGKWEGGR